MVYGFGRGLGFGRGFGPGRGLGLGLGRGFGLGRGMGLGPGRRGGTWFGFRSASPYLPFYGWGRGGLPRYDYPGMRRATMLGIPYK